MKTQKNSTKHIHQDLFLAQKIAYNPNGLIVKNITQKQEDNEYGALNFEINFKRIAFRVGKVVPVKKGQFLLPKILLCEKGYISDEGKKRKLAIRLYPTWNIISIRQAQNTKGWQICYFFEIPFNKNVDINFVQKFFLNYIEIIK
jgi:hypothetical protein